MDSLNRDLIFQVNKYKLLYQVTEKLHSSMDVDTLLRELFIFLPKVYPNFSYKLLLSHDTHSHRDLPILDFEYDSENINAIKAYISGSVNVDQSSVDGCATIYAPLKGKQGVYGVLQVVAVDKSFVSEEDVNYFTLLACTVGSALENAQLYKQSNQVISNLQLINETAHILNTNIRMTDAMVFMTKQIKSSFHAQEVGFFFSTDNQVKVLPGSTPFFSSKQSRAYIDFIEERIQKDNEPLLLGDFSLPNIECETNYRSIMAVPMIQSANLKGFSIVMHQKPYFFSFEMFNLLQSLLHYSSLALSNSMLREELENLVITDHLTKLHSRNYLDEKVQKSMTEDDEGSFILIDIDNFKRLNDTYGHQVGDELLIQIANQVKTNIRETDIGARWGGEELAIYLPKVSLLTGIAIAEKVVKSVSDCTNPHITVSCGVSYWENSRFDSYKYLFKRADEALYSAKRTGKNKVVSQKESV